MVRRILVFAAVALLVFQGSAFAIETHGETVFRDTLYGTAIGALVGSAVYLLDQDNFGEKLGVGIVVGAVGGLIYGLTETRSFVEIKNDEVKIAVPVPRIKIVDNNVVYSASLLNAEF